MARSLLDSALCVIGACLVSTLSACDPEPAPRTWPAGTVFALDDLPISADEIDVAADVIAQLEPDSVTDQVRRIAVTNVIFPRAAGILVAGAKREEARERALRLKLALEGGADPDVPLEGSLMQKREGGASDLGFEAWSYASTAAIGKWSEPLETVGAFEVVRLDEHSNAPSARQVRYKLHVCVVPYVEESQLKSVIEAQLDRSKLTIVSPEWGEIVPEYWKHRLRAGVEK